MAPKPARFFRCGEWRSGKRFVRVWACCVLGFAEDLIGPHSLAAGQNEDGAASGRPPRGSPNIRKRQADCSPHGWTKGPRCLARAMRPGQQEFISFPCLSTARLCRNPTAGPSLARRFRNLSRAHPCVGRRVLGGTVQEPLRGGAESLAEGGDEGARAAVSHGIGDGRAAAAAVQRLDRVQQS